VVHQLGGFRRVRWHNILNAQDRHRSRHVADEMFLSFRPRLHLEAKRQSIDEPERSGGSIRFGSQDFSLAFHISFVKHGLANASKKEHRIDGDGGKPLCNECKKL
jgi:hypothetical protein